MVGVAAVSVAALLQAAPAPQKGGDKTTYCIAIGADEKPVTNMTKDDFAIREDQVDRTVVSAKQATDPIDIVLIIDTSKSSSSPDSIALLRDGLVSFAKTLYGGPAPVTMSVVNSAGSSVTVAENKKSLDDVTKTLQKTFADTTSGGTVILEAIADAAKQLAKSPDPRRAIVVVNMDAISEGSSLNPPDVLQKLIASGASLWAVTYQNQATKNLSATGSSQSGGGGSSSKGAGNGSSVGMGNLGQTRELVLQRSPALGGARFPIEAASGLQARLNEVASFLVNQYAVTYTRPDGPLPKLFQMASVRPDAKVGFSQIPVK